MNQRACCAALMALLACADDDDTDAACPLPADTLPPLEIPALDPLCEGDPCGGDLTGSWEIVASCTSGIGDASFFGCAEGSLRFGTFDVSGTFTFAADGTVTTAAREYATGRVLLPLSCYPGFDCATLAALAVASGVEAICEDRGPIDAASCAVSTDACECALTLDDPDLMQQGTITTDPAGTFVLTVGEEEIGGVYCVSSDELWLHGVRFGGVEYSYRYRRIP
jgi:hypothetical protein